MPLTAQYSLIPDAHPRLIYTISKVRPSMFHARNSDAFGPAMALPELAGIEKVVSNGADYTNFADLLKGHPGSDLAQAYGAVGPDNVGGSPAGDAGLVAVEPCVCRQPKFQYDPLQWRSALFG